MGAGAVYGLFLLSLLFSFLSGTPYIGIPRKSLYEILAFGELTGDDIFYDLGSGDGRVLITAREHFGVARAVGFEIAPWPYFVSRARVALKRLAGHISIHYKSFLKADLSPASFVYVYLYRELLNEKVAPKLARWQGFRKFGTHSLISQNKSFLEGEKLFSDLAFDTLAFGYLYDIREGKVRLSPGADLSVLMFHYKLSDGVGLVDRSYSKASVRVGGVAGIELGDFTLELEGFYSFPLDNSPEINEINLSLIYPVVQGDDFTLEASAGVGLREIKYEDNQDFPNKIEIDQCPIIVLGLRLGF